MVVGIAIVCGLIFASPFADRVFWPFVTHTFTWIVVAVASVWLGIALIGPRGAIRGLVTALFGAFLTGAALCAGGGIWIGVGYGAAMPIGSVTWRTAQYQSAPQGESASVFVTGLYHCDRSGWFCTLCLFNRVLDEQTFRVEKRGDVSVLWVRGELVSESTPVACDAD